MPNTEGMTEYKPMNLERSNIGFHLADRSISFQAADLPLLQPVIESFVVIEYPATDNN